MVMIIRRGYRKRVSLIIMHVFSDVISYFFMGFCTGAAEQVRQTWQPPDRCFDWDNIADSLLVGERSPVQIHACTNVMVRRAVDTWERTDFESGGHIFSAGVAWNTIRLNTKQNSDQLVCVAPSCGCPGDWNHRWILTFMHANMKWVRILLPCQD